MNLYLGQKAVCNPKTISYRIEDRRHKRGTMTGVVSYIHPEERFIMVDFETPGGVLRESFDPKEVQFGK